MITPGKAKECGEKQDHQIVEAVALVPTQTETGKLDVTSAYCVKRAYKWATAGSSSNPCSEIYHGPKPFSDPETLAVAEYINKTQNVKLFVDFHSYGNMFMRYEIICVFQQYRPWGWSSAIPQHENQMKKLNDDCAAAIKSVNGLTFKTGRIAVTIYPASGSTAGENIYN